MRYKMNTYCTKKGLYDSRANNAVTRELYFSDSSFDISPYLYEYRIKSFNNINYKAIGKN